MLRKTIIWQAIFLSVVLGQTVPGLGQPSPAECRSSGGPTVCVRYDILADAPVEDLHFTVEFDGLGIPSVQLRLQRK
jgi:hypothetical protein